MSLFSELERRNVLRVAAAYIAVAWLVIQVAETLFPVFGVGDAVIRGVVILLAIGFVPAVISAWAFELTPEGFIRDREVDRGSPAIRRMTQRLDRLIMVALALALGYFAFDKWVLDPSRDRAREQEIAREAKEAGRAEAVRRSADSGSSEGPPMVAVLPFVSISGGEDSAFFAAGVHDDLLTQLAQLESLRVISRTSVMEYRDTERNIREIGQALGADAILEGGVQTAGDRIRINAQLIDARTDEHLWAETYDRELIPANIFDVQTEIAGAIAAALQGTVTDRDARNLSLIPTRNMAAYRTYHQALNMRDSKHGVRTSPEYRALLREAAELDPNFTRPLAELVGSLSLPNFRQKDPALIEAAERTLAEIEAVAPNSSDFLIAQAYYTYYILQDFDLAHAIASEALEMSPSDVRLVEMKSWIERRQGNFYAMIDSIRQMRSLDPRNPRWTQSLINNLILTHQYDEAQTEIETRGRTYWELRWLPLLRVREHGDLGRYAEEMEAVYKEFRDNAPVLHLWDARIAARDFTGAAALLDQVSDAEIQRRSGLSMQQIMRVFTYWCLEQQDRLADALADGWATVEEHQNSDGYLETGRTILEQAFLSAAGGGSEQAEMLVRRWNREVADDWASRIPYLDIACRMLGMAGIAEAAGECIRTGLAEPSSVMPFLEPFLPYYDSVRDSPEFIELLAELGVP
ncbi:MAG: hypothetical protein PVF61_05995 [Gammaproteobacteria bacterium]|jgi:TolB-like protein